MNCEVHGFARSTDGERAGLQEAFGHDQKHQAHAKGSKKMEKLIITATCDSTVTYPRNPHCPKPSDAKAVAAEYVRSANAGAAIAHTHGSYTIESTIQPDRRQARTAIFDGWRDITERIRSSGNPILQFGLASVRKEQKVQLWRELHPEMASVNFNSHDEYFQPDPVRDTSLKTKKRPLVSDAR